MAYFFTVVSGSVVFENVSYVAGGKFETDDPCVLLAFFEAYRAANPDLDVKDVQKGALADVQRACKDQRDPSDEFVPAEGQHDEPVEEPRTTGTDGLPDGGEETPESLGLPTPDISGEAGIEGEVLPGLTPPELYYYGNSDTGAADVYDELRAGGLGSDDAEEATEEARKGEAEGEPHAFRSEDEETEGVTSADPVNLFTGEYYCEKTDLAIPSRGFGFEFIRRYRSGRVWFGPFGFNWDHNYNVCLRELLNGQIGIRSGNLHEDLFELQPDGTWSPPAGLYARLERDSASPISSAYTLTYPGGLVWRFERPSGWPGGDRVPLIRIEDSHAIHQELLYTSGGALDRVIDTIGRTIRFEYNNCQRLAAVVDFSGRRVQYEYSDEGEHLACATLPATDDFPDGVTTQYEYDSVNLNPALRHNMVRMVDANGETIVENQYGEDPASDAFNRVVQQFYLGEEYAYSYIRLRFLYPLPENINDATFRVEVRGCCCYQIYTFNYRGNLLDHRFRLCADGSYRLWAMTYRYNSSGEVIEIRKPNGLGVRYTYDESSTDVLARGNLLQVALIAPPTSALLDRVIWRFTYDPRFQGLKTATDEANATTTWLFDYEDDPPGSQAGDAVRVDYPDVTLPDGTIQKGFELTSYNEFGQPVRHTSATGTVTAYEYYETGPACGQVSRVTADPDGDPLISLFDYDVLGRMAGYADAVGRRTEYTFDALDRLRAIRLPAVNGRHAEMRMSYDERGLLIRQQLPRGSYSDNVIRDDFIQNEFDYDPGGRMLEARLAGNTLMPRVWRYEHDLEGRLRKLTDPLGRTSEFTVDERGLTVNAALMTNTPEARVWTYHYDVNGNMDLTTEPDGRKTQCIYDSWDRQQKITYPLDAGDLATMMTMSYGARNELITREVEGPDSTGNREILVSDAFTYDERGRLWRNTRSGVSSETTFDADGRVTARSDARGNRWTVDYDRRSLLSRVTDPLGNVEEFEHDSAGYLSARTERFTDPETGALESSTQRFNYDERGRAIAATDALGNTVETVYDDRDLAIASIDAAGHRSNYKYDLNNALIRVQRTVNGTSLTQSWQRDVLGRIISYTDGAGRTTKYELDAHNAPVRVTYADGSAVSRTYGGAGQLVEETTPNGTRLDYSYDGGGRLAGVSFTPGPGVASTEALSFQYDGLDRLVRASTGSSTMERSYDPFDRIVRESLNGSASNAIYDDVNGFAEFVFPDGRRDRLSIDPLDRISSIHFAARGAWDVLQGIAPGAELARYSYSGNRFRSRYLANGTKCLYGYDGALRLVSTAHNDATGRPLASTRYVHDARGLRRLSFSQPAPGAPTLHDLDEAGRLVSTSEGVTAGEPPLFASQADADAYLASIDASTAVRRHEYALDSADNRTTWSISDNTGAQSFSALNNVLNELVNLEETSASGASTAHFLYDGNGNLTDDGRFTYQYDALDQLVAVTRKTDGVRIVEHSFDALGRVIRRRFTNSPAQSFEYFQSRIVQQQSGPDRRQNVHGLDEDDLVLASESTGNLWLHSDGSYNLTAVSDDSGSAIQRYGYAPFGDPQVWDGSGATNVDFESAVMEPHFAGRPYLAALGGYDMRARFYAPAWGRFLQRDPLHYRDSACPFVYAGHDPINRIDPTGAYLESAWDAVSLGVGVVSLGADLSNGSYGWAAVDAVGILADAAAICLPVPGGAGAGLKALRVGGSVGAAAIDLLGEYRVTVRTLQAVNQMSDVARGMLQMREDFLQGNYGWGLFDAATSTLGIRGAFGKAAQALHEMDSVPRVIYSVQGSFKEIRESGRIFGLTEGRVWGMTIPNPPPWRSGVERSRVWKDKAIYMFVGPAAMQFKRYSAWGLYSGWKAVGGQYTTGWGDLEILNRADDLASRTVVVFYALPLRGTFGGQSRFKAFRRWLAPKAVDALIGTVPFQWAAKNMLDYADAQRAQKRDRPSAQK